MNNKIKISLLLFIVLTVISMVFVLSSHKSTALQQDVLALNDTTLPHASMGFVAKSLSDGRLYASINSNQYFMPASNQKILTAIAALLELSPSYQYPTTLYYDKKSDAYYLYFSGDPTLTTRDLVKLFKTLKAQGISTIAHDLHLIANRFDTTPISNGSSYEDTHYCWNAPIDTATLNQNCVHVKIGAGERIGSPLRVTPTTTKEGIHFISQAKTAPKEKDDCIIDLQWVDDTTYKIKGCLPLKSGIRTISMANPNPHRSVKKMIRYALTKNSIQFQHRIHFNAKVPKTAERVATHLSEPLNTLIQKMMKDSDNLIANALFKTLGATRFKTIGSFQNGARAVSEVIKEQLHVEIPTRAIADGSGASRYNFVTPDMLVNAMEAFYKSENGSLLLESMPIAGVDGSLKNRMKSAPLKGNVFAKTGTMTGVSSLSGFLKDKKGKLVVFAFIQNGFVTPQADAKALEDKVCSLTQAASSP